MTAIAKHPAEQQPDFYTGARIFVADLDLGQRVLAAKVRALKQGNASGSAVQQKLAAEQISKVAGELQNIADALSRMTVSHLNRRAR